MHLVATKLIKVLKNWKFELLKKNKEDFHGGGCIFLLEKRNKTNWVIKHYLGY